MRLKHLALAVIVAASGPTWAVNKCTAADGRVTYQEEPCPLGDAGKEIKIHNDLSADDAAYGGGSSSAYLSGVSSGRRAGGSGYVYTGPRGGRYTITGSGKKSYVPRK